MLLLAIGRMKAGPERALLQRYIERCQGHAKALGISGVTEIEIEESRARDAAQRKVEEGLAIRAKVPAGARVLLLDERGYPATSVQLAERVATSRDRGQSVFCFAVGGPDGFAPDLLAEHETLSFGGATFPHQLVRVLVAEQMYRITTILAGHPYHRA